MTLDELKEKVDKDCYNVKGCYDEDFRADLYEALEDRFPLEDGCAPELFDDMLNFAYENTIYGSGHKVVLQNFLRLLKISGK